MLYFELAFCTNYRTNIYGSIHGFQHITDAADDGSSCKSLSPSLDALYLRKAPTVPKFLAYQRSPKGSQWRDSEGHPILGWANDERSQLNCQFGKIF